MFPNGITTVHVFTTGGRNVHSGRNPASNCKALIPEKLTITGVELIIDQIP